MKIVTAGDNCVDLYVHENMKYAGGNPVNVAVYCKEYFEDVSYIGVVGNDENGRFIINSLQKKSVNTSHIRIVEGKTAVTEVEITNNDRVFLQYNAGVHASFNLIEEDFKYIGESDLLVTGIYGQIEHQVGLVKERHPSVKIGFDFANKVDNPIIWDLMNYIDYAFFSWEDASDKIGIEEFLKKVISNGVTVAVVTLGKQGSLAYDGKEFNSYGIIPCEVVDTMGAGDSFIAGFLCGILENKSIKDCMIQGTQCSTRTIQHFGAW